MQSDLNNSLIKEQKNNEKMNNTINNNALSLFDQRKISGLNFKFMNQTIHPRRISSIAN